MSDIMRPIPFERLLNWIAEEFNQKHTVFSLPKETFFHFHNKSGITLFGEFLENPLGPAAGPHTQLTQNIVSAYLSGGRFFELKTVQKLDQLHIPKPCIDAQDEGYNVEWSQELRLNQSFDEYVKAWFLLHFIKEAFGLSQGAERGFIFNMSVGYDLKGIQTESMDRFIEELKDAGQTEQFFHYKQLLAEFIAKEEFFHWLENIHGKNASNLREKLAQTIKAISPNISNSVTVSTMHGCPPDEIEAICRYLLKEKHLHTYVKLNPTLLGYPMARNLLDTLGYKYIELDPAAFEHDLQYRDAAPMIKRLQTFARKQELHFGIKLSNTLGIKNGLKHLQGDEMYMSGRSLFPLTINLAYKLASEFDGRLQVSYSGGASIYNVKEILQTGIAPVTMVTELLKPGGYSRLFQMAQSVQNQSWTDGLQGQVIDGSRLKKLAEKALIDPFYRKEYRAVESIKINKTLPQFDCYVSPCREACPIHQDIAEYIRLVEEGRYLDAYKVIIKTNPLPHILGYICDQQCMDHCTRWDYESPVYIREMKKIAAENAWQEFFETHIDTLKPPATNGIRVAVIGAGPSGLSAAYFLARAGFEVTILEKSERAGGVVQNVIPDFRLPQHAIDRDVELVRRLGVDFRFGASEDFSIEILKRQGFKYIFLGIGAGKARQLRLKRCSGRVMDALDFLKAFRRKKAEPIGKKVAVIGGGNSAMDAARAALRIDSVEKVSIVYRRTKKFMTADKEEFDEAIREGAQFKELLLPVAFEDGRLKCQKMALGEWQTDGRRSVRPIKGIFETLEVNTVISAIGEEVDTRFLEANGIKVEKGKVLAQTQSNETSVPNVFVGGDALRGPSTVVESVADGKRAAEAILRKEEIGLLPWLKPDVLLDQNKRLQDIRLKKGLVLPFDENDASKEAFRCLGCNLVCDKCVDVCPNRANVAIPIPVKEKGVFHDISQIVHIDGMCNECGNCATFCPYQGAPYKDKITIFWSKEDFANSGNDGFLLRRHDGTFAFDIRFQGKIGQVFLKTDGDLLTTNWNENNVGFKRLLLIMQEIVVKYGYLLMMDSQLTLID